MQCFEIKNYSGSFFVTIFAKDIHEASHFAWSMVTKKHKLIIKQLNKKSPV